MEAAKKVAIKQAGNVSQKTFFIVQLLDTEIFNLVTKQSLKRLKTKKSQIIALFVAGLIVMLVHMLVFFHCKNQNFYEMFKLKRYSSASEIQAQTDAVISKIEEKLQGDLFGLQAEQEKLQFYKNAQQILLHSTRKNLYDKFLEESDEYNQFNTKIYMFQKMLQTSTIYFVILLQILARSLQRKYRSSAKWIIVIIVVFLLVEIDLVISNTQKKDFFDKIFPHLTIFERGELLKILLLPIIMVIRQYFSTFSKTKEEKIMEQLLETKKLYQTIEQSLNEHKTSAGPANDKLIAMQAQIKNIEQLNAKLVKLYGDGISDSDAKMQILESEKKKDEMNQAGNKEQPLDAKQKVQTKVSYLVFVIVLLLVFAEDIKHFFGKVH